MSELKRRSCESEGSGVILDEGMVSDLVSGDLWPEPCRRWVRWTEEEKLWIWRSGVILDEGMVSDLVSGVLWSESCRRWVNWREEAVNLKDLEWFWMKELSLISCQVFSDLNPVEDEWGELKRRSCESEDLEWFWMKEWSLISCQVFSDLNPVEDEWTEEEKLWIWRSGVILDEGMVSDLVSGVLWPEPCRRWVRWTEEKKLWIWRSGVILDEGMVSDLVSGVLWSEPCRRWVSELKRRSCESEDLEWFWMKEWSLISCQVISDLNPVEDEWGELKRRSCESGDLEWFWMKEWSLISCQVFSDLNPVEDEWTEEEKLWIWRSGVILDEGMVSDLVSGVLWPEPCRRWVSELKRRSCESEDLEWFWMKEWSLISCQVFSDLNPVEDEWTEEEKLWIWRSGVILDEGMVSDLVSGVLWPEPCRRWVRWTEEKKLWI